jgi:hypothetical protein
MSGVFISYARADKVFARKLCDAIKARGQDAWIDIDWSIPEFIPSWWKEIQRAIEAANTFVFILSPDSLDSKTCQQEIDHAVRYNKRLAPIETVNWTKVLKHTKRSVNRNGSIFRIRIILSRHLRS